MSYAIAGLDPAPFKRFYGLSEAALATGQVVRMTADSRPGFPCRVTLEDAEPGEALLLLNYEHLPDASPYRSRHAIFVREGAETPALYIDEIPEQLATRLLSVRAFDRYAMMTNADVVEGNGLEPLIETMFTDPAAAFLHVHNAKRGCFAARVDRFG
ncbi:DUF1203 domain-containing protein [Sphingomonas psychrotolerans]|uniref:DUF1203 domain-containing protein n=1 Tax=Sphingomonas psychrotolerans TaxID=1327635 RepID=A0A2K8MIP2_9SPHN|nr:DUF1203 domain-containing protein [Sphingomonas psychrotolerans]ATY32426.1 DUF1203 domain-containing protein [Sphingomonas psychrotolerans]